MILLLSPRYSNDSRWLGKAADKAGWETHRIVDWKIPEDLRQRKDICLYGEHLFGEFLAENLNMKLLEPPDDMLQRLPLNLVQREIRLMKMAEARQEKTPKFIKPPNFKTFKARVYDSGADLPTDPKLDDEIVLVADVVEWEIEFRFFILNKEIIDYCAYARWGNLNLGNGVFLWPCTDDEADNAINVTKEAIKSIELPAATGLDVGYIKGKGWAVLEANGAWESGIYGCDASKLLPVMQAATFPQS